MINKNYCKNSEELIESLIEKSDLKSITNIKEICVNVGTCGILNCSIEEIVIDEEKIIKEEESSDFDSGRRNEKVKSKLLEKRKINKEYSCYPNEGIFFVSFINFIVNLGIFDYLRNLLKFDVIKIVEKVNNEKYEKESDLSLNLESDETSYDEDLRIKNLKTGISWKGMEEMEEFENSNNQIIQNAVDLEQEIKNS